MFKDSSIEMQLQVWIFVSVKSLSLLVVKIGMFTSGITEQSSWKLILGLLIKSALPSHSILVVYIFWLLSMTKYLWWMFCQPNFKHTRTCKLKDVKRLSLVMVVICSLAMLNSMSFISITSTRLTAPLICNVRVTLRSYLLIGLKMTRALLLPQETEMCSSTI